MIDDATLKTNSDTLIRTSSLVHRADHDDINEQIIDSKLSRLEPNIAAGLNNYTASIPWITSYEPGLIFPIKFLNANTLAATLNINGLGIINIIKNGVPTVIGDILAQAYWIYFDGTNLQLLAGSGSSINSDFFIVDYASTQNHTIVSGVVVDGFQPTTLSYTMFKNQTVTSENGIYFREGSGAFTKVFNLYDFKFIFVRFGETNATKIFSINRNLQLVDSFQNFYYDVFSRLINGNAKRPVKALHNSPLPSNTRVGNTLVASSSGSFPTVDGIAIQQYDEIIINSESPQSNNGIYVVSDPGSIFSTWILTRRSDCDTAAELNNAFTFVEYGTTYGKKIFKQIKTVTILGLWINPVSFVEYINFLNDTINTDTDLNLNFKNSKESKFESTNYISLDRTYTFSNEEDTEYFTLITGFSGGSITFPTSCYFNPSDFGVDPHNKITPLASGIFMITGERSKQFGYWFLKLHGPLL